MLTGPLAIAMFGYQRVFTEQFRAPDGRNVEKSPLLMGTSECLLGKSQGLLGNSFVVLKLGKSPWENHGKSTISMAR